MTIAKAAAKQRRPPHAPNKDNRLLKRHTLLWRHLHPDQDLKTAATAATKDFTESALLGERFENISYGAARRIIRKILIAATHEEVREAAREAGLLGILVPEPAPDVRKVLNSVETFRAQWEKRAPRPSPFLSSFEQQMSKAMRAVTPKRSERAERLRHFLDAIWGLIDPDVPISHVAALFDDVIESLPKKG